MNKPRQANQAIFTFINEVSIIAQLAGNLFERTMPAELTLPQFSVLNHFVRLGGEWTPLRLANAMQVTKGTMTNTLGHLQRKDLVSVRPDERDGRSKLVSLTAKGHAQRNLAIEALTPELLAIADAVSLADVGSAMPVLQSVRMFLDRRRD